jgi:type I restriction enzyme S subunit
VGEDGVTSNKHRFGAGQILYSKIRPALMKAVEVDFEGLCSADMYPIRSLLDRTYLWIYMLSGPFTEQSTRDANRVAMPKINKAALGAVLVPVPPLEEQYRIAARYRQIVGQVDVLAQAVDNIARMREGFAVSALAAALRDR